VQLERELQSASWRRYQPRSLQVCAASMPASWLGRGHLTASATPILLWVHCWMPSRALGALLEHELQPRNLCFVGSAITAGLCCFDCSASWLGRGLVLEPIQSCLPILLANWTCPLDSSWHDWLPAKPALRVDATLPHHAGNPARSARSR
jgi:hypothetical protein